MMASQTVNFSADSRYSLTLTVSERDTNIEGNYGIVDWVLTANANISSLSYGKYGTAYNRPVVVTIDGQTVFNQGVAYDFRNGKNITLASGNLPIYHNDDGKKTISCSASVDWTRDNTGTASLSLTATLNEIPRASGISISTDTAILGETEVTINIDSKSNSFTHVLKCQFKNGEYTIGEGVLESKKWIPDLEMSWQIPNSPEDTGTIYCYTFNNGKRIGTSQTSIKLKVPKTLKPIISSFTAIETNDIVNGLELGEGVHVQNMSKLEVETEAEGINGSTISSYEITGIDNTIYKDKKFVSKPLEGIGTKKVKVVVTDTRGNTEEDELEYTCLEYNVPQIIKVDAQRCDENGKITDDGEYLLYTFKGSISPIENKNNIHKFQISYKKTIDSSYIDKNISTTVYDLGDNYVNVMLPNVIFDNTSKYDIKFAITDCFKTEDKVILLDTANDLINFNASGKSLAIGKVSEAGENEKKLEIALDTEITGKLTLKGTSKIFEFIEGDKKY